MFKAGSCTPTLSEEIYFLVNLGELYIKSQLSFYCLLVLISGDTA